MRMSVRETLLVSIHARAKRATAREPSTRIWIWFQSTPARSGRRGVYRGLWISLVCFNPRPREAGDRLRRSGLPWRTGFNPRPREAGDASSQSDSLPDEGFQSTPARSGRRGPDIVSEWRSAFQSTPARSGRLTASFISRSGVIVSIHARAKRATAREPSTRIWIWFQSTPARSGRRGVYRGLWISLVCFNPRPREAGDRLRRSGLPWRTGFNPRPREAGDASSQSDSLPDEGFQSTPARSGRRGPDIVSEWRSAFQSTPARSGRQKGRRSL